MSRLKKIILTMATVVMCGFGLLPQAAFADMQFSVTPMNQKIILTPGEKYEGTFGVVNPANSANTFYYKLNVEPFYVDENYHPVYSNNGDYNQIVDWIKLDQETGTVEPSG